MSYQVLESKSFLGIASNSDWYQMETCMDLLNLLEPDMSIKVLMCLDNPSDLVHASSVSRSWRRHGELRCHLYIFNFVQLTSYEW